MAKLKTTNPYDDKFFAEPVKTSAKRETPSIGRTAPAGPVTRLNLDLERSLHKSFKRLCLDNDTTISDAVRALIAAAVSEGKLPVNSAT